MTYRKFADWCEGRLGIRPSASTFRRWYANGYRRADGSVVRLPGHRVGRRIVVQADALEAFAVELTAP